MPETSAQTPGRQVWIERQKHDTISRHVGRVDAGDRLHATDVTSLGLRAVVLDTLMTDRTASERLARQLLDA